MKLPLWETLPEPLNDPSAPGSSGSSRRLVPYVEPCPWAVAPVVSSAARPSVDKLISPPLSRPRGVAWPPRWYDAPPGRAGVPVPWSSTTATG
eukprot:4572859-Prymnesium_polylepis.2